MDEGQRGRYLCIVPLIINMYVLVSSLNFENNVPFVNLNSLVNDKQNQNINVKTINKN